MKTNLEKLLLDASRLYKNLETLLTAFHKLNNNTANTDISVKLVNEDGKEVNYVIKNNIAIQQEIERLRNNLANLTSENESYLLNGDGSISKIFKTDYTNNGFINETEFSPNCVISYDSIIDNLTYPNVKVPVKINNNIVEDNIIATIFTVNNGFDLIDDGITYQEMSYLLKNNTVIGNQKSISLKTEKKQIKNYGRFSILSVESESQNYNEYTLKLDKSEYENISGNYNLKIGDLLVDDKSKYQIIDVDVVNDVAKVKRIEGEGKPEVGIKNLLFNTIVDTSEKFVNIPVLPNKQLVIFLSTENKVSVSYPSDGIKIDTNTLSVQTDDGLLSLKQYYQKYVINISEYFNSLVNDSAIPLSLGVKPKRLKLDQRNFRVIQINNHLTSKLTKDELEKLNREKVKIKNDITYRQGKIQQLEKELNTSTLKTQEEIENRNNQIKNHRNEIILLEQNELIVARKIDDNAIKYGLKNSKPKYKVVGFCELLGDIMSTKTRPQKIIKYEFWYRYLSKNNDEVNATSFKLYEDNKEVNITVSPWNIAKTRTLSKTQNPVTKKFEWVDYNFDSSEEININQCLIPINEGESVEIKVRAISEAGYPLNNLCGEWSSIMRVDFPTDLTENSVNLLVNRNTNDLRLSEFQEVIRNSGIYKHLSESITDGKRHYSHDALNIASGFFTEDERRIIPLFDELTSLRNRLDILENRKILKNVEIQFVDYNENVYTIENNKTLEIDGGAYSDKFNLLDAENFGSIIKLTNYIKIVNHNDTAIELKSLVPGIDGDLTIDDNDFYYNVPVYNENYKQKRKQIIFFRNTDLTRQHSENFTLYTTPAGLSETTLDSQMLDLNAHEKNKNLLQFNGNIITRCKLIDDDMLINSCIYTAEHPMFDKDNPEKLNQLKEDFKRLAKFNKNIKLEKQEYHSDNIVLGYLKNDKYAVGKHTTGAFLYPILDNKKLQVIGSSTNATVIVQKNSEIIIPIIFEYRMTDRLGVINGDKNHNLQTNVVYRKKLGIDLLLDDKLIGFDLEFKADLKRDVPSLESLNILSIAANNKKI